MADFESIIRNHVGEDGNIPTTAINAIVTAIKQAVGNEYVDKERYKAKLTEIDGLKEQLQTADDNATTAGKWKTKYDALKEDFQAFKDEQAAKETKATKQDAYKKLLKEAGVSEKRIESVLKVSDVDKIDFEKDGTVKGADDLVKGIKEEWADFITTDSTHGAQTANPPANNPTKTVGNPRAAELSRQFTATRYGEINTKGE